MSPHYDVLPEAVCCVTVPCGCQHTHKMFLILLPNEKNSARYNTTMAGLGPIPISTTVIYIMAKSRVCCQQGVCILYRTAYLEDLL